MSALSDQQLTVAGSAVGLTVPSTASRAYMEVHTASIYYTWDGDTPSSSNGGCADPGDIIDAMDDSRDSGKDKLSNFSTIRQTSTSGLLIIHYFT